MDFRTTLSLHNDYFTAETFLADVVDDIRVQCELQAIVPDPSRIEKLAAREAGGTKAGPLAS